MAVWPFGRRSRRPSEATAGESTAYPTEHIHSTHPATVPTRKPSKGSSSKRPRRRTASTRNSTKDSIKDSTGNSTRNGDTRNLQVSQLAPIQPVSPIGSRLGERPRTPDSQASAEDITALPQSTRLKTSPHLRPATRNDADIPYDFRLYSSSSRLGTPTPQANQQLQRQSSKKQRNRLSRSSSGKKKQYATDLPRKISKKRRDSNPVREEDFRAMSAPAVVPRPMLRTDSSILRRDSKKVRGGLNRNFERPMSNISLPRPDSGPSSKSGAKDARSYRISVMDIMSPRPVIRVSEPYSMVTLGYPSNSSRATAARRPTSSGKLASKKSRRVDDLADDLDSSEIRAAMDRERRRKENKKERDAEKLKQRLERRAEKDRAQEEAADDAALGALSAAVAAAAAGGSEGTRSSESTPKKKERRREKSDRSASAEAHPPTAERMEGAVVPALTRTKTPEPPAPSRAPPPRPESPRRELSQQEPPKPTRTPPSPLETEPVLDLAAVEPPESFAPLESAERRDDVLREEQEESPAPSTRVSPLLPTDGDEIPGLPFLGSASDIESPIHSPLNSTHFDHDDDAAPPPIIHRDPLNIRETRYSSLSPIPHPSKHASTPSVTALPQVPGRTEQAQPGPKKKRRPSLLFSFFRRGEKRKSRNRSTSEGDTVRADSGMAFANISREGPRVRAGNAAATPQNVQSNTSPLSSKIATPVRSRSKFREDLPGLNIRHLEHKQLPSPPESRIHSPVSHLSPGSPEYMRGAMITPISAKHISEHSEYEVVPEDEQHQNRYPAGMSNPLTQSLASIDSEGSWFTGRRAKRGMSNLSGNLQNPSSQRDSGSHQGTRRSGQSTPLEGNITPLNDEERTPRPAVHKFPANLDPEHERYPRSAKTRGSPPHVARSTSNEAGTKTLVYGGRFDTDEDPLKKRNDFGVYGDVARQPEVRQGIRIKSSEALLKEALAAAVVVDEKLREQDMALRDPDSDDPETPDTDHLQLHRATSIKARRIGGEDAKLIEVSKRRSGGLPSTPTTSFTQ